VISREQSRLRTEINQLLDKHTALFADGHDGAHHCPCDLAQQIRDLEEAYFAASPRQKAKRLRLQADVLGERK
jgi:hypothetical protein